MLNFNKRVFQTATEDAHQKILDSSILDELLFDSIR